MAFVPESFFGIVDDIWFTDNDDGTLIHIFDGGGLFSPDGTRCPGPDFLFEQNVVLNSCNELDGGDDESIVCPGFGTVIRGSFKLSIDPTTPLPADHSFSSGSISRFDDRLVMYVEEFTPSRVSEPTSLIGQQKFNIVKTFITRYDFVNTESLGTSDGSASQTFTVSGSEILLPTTGTPIVFVGGIESGTKFSVTDDLSTAIATSTVFEYDPTTGTVTFGDGTNGAIPQSGEEIVLRITIRNGGGQWTFASIVEPPKSTKNIGGVKSIRDKTFYVQTGIALADAARMTSVVTEVNFAKQDTYDGEAIPSKLMRTSRRYDLAFGGEMNATGGAIVLAFASGVGYVEVLPATTATFVRLDVNTGIVYPSFRATTPVPSPAPVDLGTPTPRYDAREVRGGVHTSPKLYEDDVRIEPVFIVQETQNFRTIVGPDLVADPYYTLSFTIGEFGGFPIVNDRDKRLIKIGDPTPPSGMTRLSPTVDPSEEWTGGTGTFADPVQTGIFGDLDGPESESGLTNQVIVENGRYSQILIGSSDRHLEWITIEAENRQFANDAALATHIFGSALPAFVCTWTFEEGSVTELPDLGIVP